MPDIQTGSVLPAYLRLVLAVAECIEVIIDQRSPEVAERYQGEASSENLISTVASDVAEMLIGAFPEYVDHERVIQEILVDELHDESRMHFALEYYIVGGSVWNDVLDLIVSSDAEDEDPEFVEIVDIWDLVGIVGQRVARHAEELRRTIGVG